MKYILLWLGLVAVSFVLSLFAEDSPFRKNQKRSPRIIDDDMDVFDYDDRRRRYDRAPLFRRSLQRLLPRKKAAG